MPMLLHRAVEHTAERLPDKTAFSFQGDRLSYGMLMERARKLAGVLTEHGLQCTDRIGIFTDKALTLPVSVYGTLMAGGAFVPIDPKSPTARVDAIIRDCDIKCLILGPTKSAQAARIAKAHPAIRLTIGSEADGAGDRILGWADVEGAPADRPLSDPSEDDLGYVMYTSGSTGAPKGLMHTHASGLAYARMSAALYGITDEDRMGNHAALHFDQATFEYFAGPIMGASITLIPEETIMFPRDLARMIAAEALTVWHSVPSTLIRLASDGALEEADLSALRWVIFGGEPFPPKHLWRLMDVMPNARFSNSYGPAEVNQCTHFHVPKAFYGSSDPLPIGHACPGADIRILGDDGTEAAPGTVGDLVVNTPTMMRGYWGRPDLDAEAFVEYPAASGQIYYRTGDLASVGEDGLLRFAGRRDRQVKLRGYRIELDEIEAVLTALAEVKEAAVIQVSDKRGEKVLMALVTLCAGCDLLLIDLKRALVNQLPGYAVPQRIEICDEFPRTTSGKIDRRRLSEDYTAAAVSAV